MQPSEQLRFRSCGLGHEDGISIFCRSKGEYKKSDTASIPEELNAQVGPAVEIPALVIVILFPRMARMKELWEKDNKFLFLDTFKDEP
jgi:hypothetical protein